MKGGHGREEPIGMIKREEDCGGLGRREKWVVRERGRERRVLLIERAKRAQPRSLAHSLTHHSTLGSGRGTLGLSVHRHAPPRWEE